MINIIGNIKVNEADPNRVQFFFATLLSFAFIPKAKICLAFNQQSPEFLHNVGQCLTDHFSFPVAQHSSENSPDYKTTLFSLFDEAEKGYNYYINFEEDHFCVLDDKNTLAYIIGNCNKHDVDLLRISYYPIEVKSAEKVIPICDNDTIKAFRMNPENYSKFQAHYTRFYLGTNAMFKMDYARKLYDRPGKRPHDFELGKYVQEYEYTCAVPKVEFLRSIDNDHEAVNSCLLKSPTDKFSKLMEQAKEYM